LRLASIRGSLSDRRQAASRPAAIATGRSPFCQVQVPGTSTVPSADTSAHLPSAVACLGCSRVAFAVAVARAVPVLYSDAASTFLRVDCGLGGLGPPPVLILPLSYTKSRALSGGLITTTGIPSKSLPIAPGPSPFSRGTQSHRALSCALQLSTRQALCLWDPWGRSHTLFLSADTHSTATLIPSLEPVQHGCLPQLMRSNDTAGDPTCLR
jgi:hypothetical protein